MAAKKCEDGHRVILHFEQRCPLCVVEDQLDEARRKIQNLENDLDATRAELQEWKDD